MKKIFLCITSKMDNSERSNGLGETLNREESQISFIANTLLSWLVLYISLYIFYLVT